MQYFHAVGWTLCPHYTSEIQNNFDTAVQYNAKHLRRHILNGFDCFLFWLKSDGVILGIMVNLHDDVIKWKHFQSYWPFVRGIHRPRGVMRIFSLICAWTNDWANHRDAGDLRPHRSHYDVIVMKLTMKTDGRVSLGWTAWINVLSKCLIQLTTRHTKYSSVTEC